MLSWLRRPLVRILERRVPKASKTKAAAKRFVAVKASEGIPALTELLNYGSWAARENVDYRSAIREKADYQAAYLLERSYEAVREKASDLLKRRYPRWLTSSRAIKELPALIGRLADCDWEVREATAIALGIMQIKEASPALIGRLGDSNWQVREAAASALGEMKVTEAVPALVEHLADSDSRVRYSAEKALGRIAPDWLNSPSAHEAVPALIACLKVSNSDSGRVAAAEILGTMRAIQAVPTLIERLADRSSSVRRATSEALLELIDLNWLNSPPAHEAVPALIACLGANSDSGRQAAAKILGALRATQAVPKLIECLADGSSSVRDAANEALKLIDSSWLNSPNAPEAIPALIKCLSDRDKDIQMAAAKVLGAMGATEAIPALIASLKSSDINIREAAAKSLGTMKAFAAIPALIEHLADDERVVRAVAKALGAMQAVEAIPALIGFLAHRSNGSVAKETLDQIDPNWMSSAGSQAIPVLIERLVGFRKYDRKAAKDLLEQIDGDWTDSPKASEGMIRLIRQLGRAVIEEREQKRNFLGCFLDTIQFDTTCPNDSRIRNAVEALGIMKSSEAIPLFKSMKTSHLDIRKVEAMVLERFGPKCFKSPRVAGAAHALIECLAVYDLDVGCEVREAAANILGAMKASEAVPSLVKYLSGADADVRMAATGALGSIEGSELISMVIDRLAGCHSKVSEAIEKEMERIDSNWLNSPGTPERIAVVIKRFVDSDPVGREIAGRSCLGQKPSDVDVRTVAAGALGAMRATEAVPVLIKCLADWSSDRDVPEVQKAAASALGAMRATEAVPALIKCLTRGDDEDVREAAIKALGAIKATEAIPAVVKQLTVGNIAVRKAAANTLGTMNATEVVPVLAKCLEDSSDDVREAAANALGALKATEAIPALVVCLADTGRAYGYGGFSYDYARVREAANKALDRIDPNWGISPVAYEAIPALIKHLKDHSNDPSGAAWFLGAKKATEAIPALIERLVRYRGAASKALEQIDSTWQISPYTPQGIAALIERLADKNLGVRKSVAEALVFIGHSRGVEVLLEFTSDSTTDKRERKPVVEQLLQVGAMHTPWLEAQSHLLCTSCCLRLNERRLSNKYVSVSYLCCRGCDGWYAMVQGVQDVVGVIGNSDRLTAGVQENGCVYVRLWSEEEKKARNADIDLLEIGNGPGTSYDWAIDAVVLALKNDASRPADYLKRVSVRLVGNPDLSQSALHILEKEFARIDYCLHSSQEP